MIKIRDIVKNKKAMIVVRAAVAVLLLIYLIYFIEPEKLTDSLIGANPILLAAGFILVFPLFYFQYDKWRVFCSEIVSVQSNRQIFHSLLAGISAGILTPMRLGEHLGRILILNDKKKSDVLVLSVVDKFMPHLFYPVFGLIAYYRFLAVDFPLTVNWIFALVVAVLIFSSIFIFRNRQFREFLKRFEIVKTLWDSIGLLKGMKLGSIFRIYFDSLLIYLINISQYAILIWAFTGDANFIDYFFGAAFIFFFKSLLPVISIGDLGIREITAVYFLAYFSVGEAAAFNASILLAIFNLFIPAALSLFLVKPETA